MKSAFEASGKDLWPEFEEKIQILKDQEESQTRKQTDISDRLERMEKMMQTMTEQMLINNMGVKSHGLNGDTMTNISEQWRAFLNSGYINGTKIQ